MSNDEKNKARRESLKPNYDTPAASLAASLESNHREIPENVVYVADHDINIYNQKQDKE